MKTSPPDRPVLILGARDDKHVQEVARRVEAEGGRARILDTRAFPEETRLELTETLAGIRLDGHPLELPGAVYLRGYHAHALDFGVEAGEEMSEDWRTTSIAFQEKSTLLRGLVARWEALGVPIYNPPSCNWRTPKPVQLALLQAAGLPVPRTLWRIEPEAVRRFAAGGRVAYKPVHGGAATRELGPEDLTDARLAALQSAPVTFQELLPGEDIRVYVLDGEIIASVRILSRALDFRQNEEHMEPFELPPEVVRQCLRAIEVIGLRWTGMDLKRDAQGTLRLLELNSSPMFLGFDTRVGTDVLGHFAQGLVRAARSPAA